VRALRSRDLLQPRSRQRSFGFRRSHTFLLAVLLAGFAGVSACGGAMPNARLRPRTPVTQPRKPIGVGIPALRAKQIAKVPEGTFGPYVGQAKGGALVVWAAEDANAGTRGWYATPVGDDGTPRAAARRLADAPPDVGLVVVRGNADSSELALASTRRTALGEWIEVALIRVNGELVSPPRQIVELKTRALWLEVVPLGQRRLLLWALPKQEEAEVYGVVLNARAEPEAEPTLLAGGVRAWQAAELAGGAVLGSVRAAGAVELTFFDSAGKPKGKPVQLSSSARATLDFDLAPLGESLMVAWSDGRDGEPRVFRSIVGADGSVRVPEAPVTPPFGAQALVRVVARPGAKTAWLLWESPAERDGSSRAFDLAGVDQDGRTTPERGRIWLESEDAVPEVAALADGVGALTLSSACRRDANCSEEDVMPTFVRFGSTLELKASEPLRLDTLNGAPAELGWALSCGDTQCFALAALGESPAPVFVTALERRSDAWQPAALKLGTGALPRVRENRVLAASEPLASVSVLKLGEGSLAGYLTDFDPTTPWTKLKKAAPDGRFEPLRARLDLLALGPDGAAIAPPQNLSIRAHSLGGIALAPGAANTDALAAWVGVDAGQPQVFLTLVGPNGARRSQRMLTRKSGDASDVAVSTIQNGWLVAWVDERDGDPEVYTTRVDAKLARIGNEQRVTKAPGSATQLSLVSLDDGGVLAWADARDTERPGEADIYLTRLAQRDAAPIGGEKSLLRTRGHSFAPALRRVGSGLLLAWLERGAPDAPGSAGIVFQELDASGVPSGDPTRVALARGEPTALAIDCSNDVCRVVLAARDGDDAALYAGVRRGASQSFEMKRLLALGSRGSVGTPLALRGDELVYADADAEGQWRVRRALLDWP
jgi:hypothetical protein